MAALLPTLQRVMRYPCCNPRMLRRAENMEERGAESRGLRLSFSHNPAPTLPVTVKGHSHTIHSARHLLAQSVFSLSMDHEARESVHNANYPQ